MILMDAVFDRVHFLKNRHLKPVFFFLLFPFERKWCTMNKPRKESTGLNEGTGLAMLPGLLKGTRGDTGTRKCVPEGRTQFLHFVDAVNS